jgi:hypothetical protein
MMVITKNNLKSEIDSVDDQYLDILYKFIKTLQKPEKKELSLMAKLKSIKIQAPADFSENIDAYLTGEKHVE